MRIRWRLALYAATVTFLGLFGFILLLLALGNATSGDDQQKSLDSAIEAAVGDYRDLDLSQLQSTVTPFLVDSPRSLDIFLVAVDESGVVQFSTGLVEGREPDIPALVILETFDDGMSKAVADDGEVEMRMASLPWPDSWPGRGVLVAVQPTEFAVQQLQGLAAALWIAGLITVIATTVVGWLVSGRALRPLAQLVETTDAIGETGDLSQRLPEVRTRDEVGRLTTSFNSMLARLEETRARLASSLEVQRQFVADASHELRSPLTTIRSNAGFLIDRPEAEEGDRSEAIADVAAEADRMSLLVDDLLMLARGDEGLGLAERPVDLTLLAGEIQRRAERLGIEIVLEIGENATVVGDEPMLDRLLWIMVDNAAKHGRQPIRLQVLTSASRVALRVIDVGAGFPEGVGDKVFDRFFRADPARSPAGVGLGLSIARWITEAHGGTISAENHKQGGAVLTADLPRA